jgi:hypothetical protein
MKKVDVDVVILYIDTMKTRLNRKNMTILGNIFHDPVRSDIPWKDIESLIIALSGEITEGSGSRVRMYLNGVRAVFHCPHPHKFTDKGALKSMRRFLKEAGIDNVEI